MEDNENTQNLLYPLLITQIPCAKNHQCVGERNCSWFDKTSHSTVTDCILDVLKLICDENNIISSSKEYINRQLNSFSYHIKKSHLLLLDELNIDKKVIPYEQITTNLLKYYYRKCNVDWKLITKNSVIEVRSNDDSVYCVGHFDTIIQCASVFPENVKDDCDDENIIRVKILDKVEEFSERFYKFQILKLEPKTEEKTC